MLLGSAAFDDPFNYRAQVRRAGRRCWSHSPLPILMEAKADVALERRFAAMDWQNATETKPLPLYIIYLITLMLVPG